MKNRYINKKLKNNLEYLLIYNNYINKSSFSMDVKVGVFDEDIKSKGYSHLIEHLIFNSKQKNKFLDAINKAQGSFNAKTTYEYTNYRFDCDSSSFLEILAMFLDFFISPNFSANKITKELKIIKAEFNKEEFLEEYFFLLKSNIKINSKNKKVIIKRLNEFYKKYYNSNNIKVAVQTNLNVEEINNLLEHKLSKIRTGFFNNNIFNIKSLKQKIQIDSNKNLLKLYFFLPDIHPYIDTKVNWFLKDLISAKHKHSLYSFIADFVNEINTTIDIYSKFTILCVEFCLNSSNNYISILNLFYSYIEFLKGQNIPKYYYNEQKLIAKTRLNSILCQEGSNFISFYSRNMFYYKAKNINKKVFLLSKYSNFIFKYLLSFINPNNSSILLFFKFHNEDSKYRFLIDTNYKIKYRELNYSKNLLNLKFKYQEKNNYIPQSLTYFPKNNIKHPYKILDKRSGSIWFLNDYNLNTYEAYINFDIVSPLVNSSPENKLLSLYYNYMVLESLEKYRDEFSLANINFGIERIDRGYSIFVVGLSSNIIKVANIIINSFLLKKVNLEQLFLLVKENLKNIYKELDNLSVYELVKYELNNILHSYNIHRNLYKDKDLSFYDFNNFFKKVFNDINLEFYVYGNISSSSIIKFYNSIYKKLDANPLEIVPSRNDIRVPIKINIINIQTKKSNTALAMFFYFGKRSTRLSAIIQIGFVFFKAYIFKELRNNYGLYFIDLKLDFYINDLGISLIVETKNYNKQKLIKILDKVLVAFIIHLEQISLKDFEETKFYFNKKILKNNLNLNDWMNELILTAVLEGNINYANELISEVLKLTVDEIVFYYKNSLNKKNRKSYTIIAG